MRAFKQCTPKAKVKLLKRGVEKTGEKVVEVLEQLDENSEIMSNSDRESLPTKKKRKFTNKNCRNIGKDFS